MDEPHSATHEAAQQEAARPGTTNRPHAATPRTEFPPQNPAERAGRLLLTHGPDELQLDSREDSSVPTSNPGAQKERTSGLGSPGRLAAHPPASRVLGRVTAHQALSGPRGRDGRKQQESGSVRAQVGAAPAETPANADPVSRLSRLRRTGNMWPPELSWGQRHGIT